MISWKEAQEIIIQKAPQMSTTQKFLSEAMGFVLAQDVKAVSDLPPFDNSAMDGFAVKIKWFENQSFQDKIRLPKKGSILAGGESETLDENAAIAIMTGAKMPLHYDAVIPIENVIVDNNFIFVNVPVYKGDNIRPQGSDIQKNEVLLKKGTLLTAYHIALLGAQAIERVSVYQKPKIAVIITGDEVGKINEASGKIADANGPFLTAAIEKGGGEVVVLFHVDDNPKKLAEKVKNIQPHVDMILSTGAVSAGVKDFIPNFILEQKAVIHFHKIYQRPGKPLLFAQLNDGTAWFGLPGNPVAVQASFDFSVLSWIKKSQQRKVSKKQYAQLKGCFKKKVNFRHFLRGFTYSNSQGQLIAKLETGQASYQLKNWGNANCWIIASEEVERLNDGDIVEVVKV